MGGFEKFRQKARDFLRAHQDHIVVHKLRRNEHLTPTDLSELERILAESGLGRPEDLEKAKTNGLGLFVRSLVGLDRAAAKRAMARFLDRANANQREFVEMVVDYLTQNGVMDPGLLWESPFTDVAPQGPEAIFLSADVDALVAALREVKQAAVAVG